VLAVANPDLRPPRSVREGGGPPRIVRAAPDQLGEVVAALVAEEGEAVGAGSVAVICASSQADELAGALTAAGVDHARAGRAGLDAPVTIVPVGLVKGLELDATVVVEPARIVDEEAQGLRALYVALTRATKRLVVAHADPLPAALRE
jgi:DNA helicase IV